MSLVLFCRSCGRQVSSGEVRDGLCLECRVRDTLGDLLPIVFVSGVRIDALDKSAGLLVGADDYVVKPFDPDELLARIRRLMAERVRELVSDDAQAAELLRKELEQARQSRYDIRRR